MGRAINPHQELHQLLLEEKTEILRHLSLGALAAAPSTADQSEEDLGPINHELFIHDQVNRIDCETLRDVEAALSRLHTGDYGVCEECEESIPLARLRAIPWARFCVSCQETHQEADLVALPVRHGISARSLL
jgi:DnaK suppressor protein